MKQITQNLRWLVTLLAMIVSIGTWAQSNSTTTSFTLNSNSGNAFTQNGVSVRFSKGNGNTTPKWYTAGHRFYAKNTITISSNKNITGIIFNWEKQGNNAFASATASDGTYSHPIETGEGVWSGSSKSITFTLGSSGQLQLNTFSVTYESGGATPTSYYIDFESSLDSYNDWEFTNIVIHNAAITAHEGTNYGATVNGNGNAVESATIQTKEKIANPATFTCYVSKESNNTTGSTWYVEVSSDGENWEDVASQSASSMSKGSWIEVTADLSNYSNVYVCLRYNGTNAIRTVDDISITLRGTPTVATPTFSPAGGSFTGTQSVTISCETTDAAIYYTINGTTPSASNGTLYEDEITISATTTIKAIAIKDNESSEIASATYEKVLLSAGLEYSASSAEVTFKETPYTLPTLSNPYAVDVTYSSLNETVATVNPTTGEVTIYGVGTTTITATFAGNDDYMPGSASYTLKVNPMNSAEIDLVNNESVTFTKDSWTEVSSGSYPSGETEKPFIGSDGTSTTWCYIYVMKKTTELQFQSQNGKLSSSKVNCPDGYGYKVTISFTSGATNPSGSLVVTASTGEIASRTAPSSGVDASLSLDVCGWSNVTISTTCSNALYVKEIKFERIEVETVTITISDKAKIDNDYYATFSNSEKPLHFGAVKGLKAYIVETAEKESSAITLSEVTKVPANTGLLVCGTTPKTYKVPVIPSTSADEILVNMLYPSTGMTGDGKSVFILANGNKGLGFYIVKNGSSLNPNQAYLKINNGTSSEIKTFFSLGGDYVNDINHIETEILSENVGAYNLNGQRVTSPAKGGLYIMNGKKVFVR